VRHPVIIALDLCPVGELGFDVIRLSLPAGTAKLRHDLLTAPLLRSVLVGFPVEHERVQGSPNLPGYSACGYLVTPFLGRPVDESFDIDKFE
jgi:hypothetical protein